jgi:hypothetical protein
MSKGERIQMAFEQIMSLLGRERTSEATNYSNFVLKQLLTEITVCQDSQHEWC